MVRRSTRLMSVRRSDSGAQIKKDGGLTPKPDPGKNVAVYVALPVFAGSYRGRSLG